MKTLLNTLLAIMLLCAVPSAAQSDGLDSLKLLLHTEKNDSIRVVLLSELAYNLSMISPDSAQPYIDEEMELAKKLSIPRLLANALNDQAFLCFQRGDVKRSLAFNLRALEIRRSIGDPALLISSLNKIAGCHSELGDQGKALQYNLEVLKLSEQIHNEQYIGLTLANIADVMLNTKRYDEAAKYLRRAINIAIANQDSVRLGIACHEMATAFEGLKQFDSAYHYQKTAVSVLESVAPDYNSLSRAYNNMAFLLRAMMRDAEALPYYKKALRLALEQENGDNISFYAANVGSILVDLRSLDSARHYLRFALSRHQPGFSLRTLKTAFASMGNYFILKGNADSAITYYNRYTAVSDSIYSEESLRQINELHTQYETEQKELQLQHLNDKNTIMQLSIFRKNVAIGAISAAFLLALVLGVLFYKRYKLKQQAKLQAEILKQKQMASEAVISAEEHERKRIAGELHDGIGQMFSVVKMNLSGIADRTDISGEDKNLLDKTIKLVDESCREVRSISHQMMPNVLNETGFTAAINQFVDKIDSHSLEVTLDITGFERKIPGNVEAVVYRIVQECVNNVIKHAQAARLDIQIHNEGDHISATIEDNGKGFDTSLLQTSGGIGVKGMMARVEFLGGKMEYDSAPGKGTVVAIHIPLNAYEQQ
jgi:signal transduction histidine kinase